VQTLTATLLDAAGQPTVHIPITFTATLRRASGVSYQPGECDDLKGVTTVQAALDLLCKRKGGGGCTVTVGAGGDFPTLNAALETLLKRGQFDICICMLPGNHTVEHFNLIEIQGRIHFNTLSVPVSKPSQLRLKIEGCGAGTRIVWKQAPAGSGAAGAPPPFATVFAGNAFVMRDVEAVVETGLLGFTCDSVSIESCVLSQKAVLNDDEALALWKGAPKTPVTVLLFGPCNHIRVANCRVSQILERPRFQTFEPFIDVHPPLALLYANVGPNEFTAEADRAAREINQQTPGKRAALTARLKEVAAPFASAARNQFNVLADVIQSATLKGGSTEAGSLAALRNVQIVAAQAGTNLVREGTTIVIDDGRSKATIHDNVLDGTLCVYGRAPSPWIQFRFQKWPEKIFQRLITFADDGGDLSVKNNRLSRVAISTDMVSRLTQLDQVSPSVSPDQRVIREIFRAAVYEGNDIKSPINQFMACYLSLSSNVLNKLPVNQTAATFPSHLAIAKQAAYVANHGSEAGTVIRSLTAQNETEKAANINLNVLP
jgi:hypothetical protein